MFSGAVAFDQPLEKWDVSYIENMATLFYHAKKYDQPINGWDVGRVTDMGFMFSSAEKIQSTTVCVGR